MSITSLSQTLHSFPSMWQRSQPPDVTRDEVALDELAASPAAPPTAHLSVQPPAPTMQAGTRSGFTSRALRLPPVPEAAVYDYHAFRRRVAKVQLNRAHVAYKDVALGAFLDARTPLANVEQLRRGRMANQAGNALVRLHAQGLLAMGFTDKDNKALAERVLRALYRANILDWDYQVSRGEERDIPKSEIDAAIDNLRLSNRQRWMVHDIVLVAKFLFDFGIREAGDAFHLDLCCGAVAFERSASWRECRLFFWHLFDPDAERKHQERLQARLLELSL